MARKRMISPEFWSDEKLGVVSRDAKLLFIGLWNFADDLGDLRDNAVKIKAQVFPIDTDIAATDVSRLIEELVDCGVLIKYSVDGTDYLSIKKFLKHQQIQHPTASTIPMSPHLALSEHSMSPHPKEERRGGEGKEKNKKEEKRKEVEEGTGGSNIFSLYEQNIGMLAPIMVEELKETEKLYPVGWVEDAFKEAIRLNKRNWKYINAILERWGREGRDVKGKKQTKAESDPEEYFKRYGHLMERRGDGKQVK